MAKPNKLPEQPKAKSDSQIIEDGEQAMEFAASGEWAWFVEQLDAKIDEKQWEKLNLSSHEGQRLHDICIEISLLNEIKELPGRFNYPYKAALKREADKERAARNA